MHDIVAMAEVQRICNCKHNLCDLIFIFAAMEVIRTIQFTSLAVLHHYVEVGGVIVDLVYLDDVRVLQLSLSHLYVEKDLAFIEVGFHIFLMQFFPRSREGYLRKVEDTCQ